MEERIKSRFRKDLLFPVLYGLGGIIFLFYMPHADEFGFWASLIFAALLLLMSALFTWLAWITRQKSLQSYQKLYSQYPELEKEFYKIYNQSRYSREKLSLYLYKDAIIRDDTYFQFLMLYDLTDLTIKIEKVQENKYVKYPHLYLYYSPMSANKDIRLHLGRYTNQNYVELLQFLDVVNQVAPQIRIYNEAKNNIL
ncbi:hypothetical protein HMPREF9383_1862 [Streptococcus sanguinis SK150]|uniref:Uncharacterized protein n=1 Tax=Streptococcus sanguinis SK150 TaxID=888811 RepID=F0IP11_STRSA|nr:hypothetical protein [Streptococcus sanguinis]EGD36086.1 hypothetical protein HMPREF9383_1862 [Streptococcus sanguinis SK150]RSI34380.1 hypothetical protein D8876_08420 [Streptococcus sanguinis]